MDKQKEIFEEFCKDFFFFDGDNKGCKTISRAKGENIIRLLKKEWDLKYYTPKFKHWVKSKGFQLVSHSALGLKHVLRIPAKTSVSGKLCIFRHLAWQCYILIKAAHSKLYFAEFQ